MKDKIKEMFGKKEEEKKECGCGPECECSCKDEDTKDTCPSAPTKVNTPSPGVSTFISNAFS